MKPHIQSIGALQVTRTHRYVLAYCGDFAIIASAYVALVTDLLGLGVRELLMFFVAVRPRRLANWIGPISLWATAFGLAAWAHAVWVPLLWVASLLTSFWAVFRVRTFAEHVGETAGPGREASHRYEVGPIGRFLFFPHNVWYHYEHHVYASVPFFNLPPLRALLPGRPVLTFNEVFDRLGAEEPTVPACAP